MKKYRKIKKTDKLPSLPKGMLPLLLLRERNYTYIFAITKDKDYTMTWDRVSIVPQEFQQIPKHYPDEHHYQRVKLT